MAERALVHRVIDRLDVGGPATHVVALTAGLGERGFASRLLVGDVTPDGGDMGHYARERQVTPIHVPGMNRRLHPLSFLRAVFFLTRLFRRERPEVVHTHTAVAGAVGRTAAILAGVPVRVHTYHGPVPGDRRDSPAMARLLLRVERWLGRRTDALIAVTPAQADRMARELRVAPRDRFRVIPPGLDLERFWLPEKEQLRARRDTRAELGIPEAAAVVGIVGRLVPVENHELLLRAFRLLEGDPRLVVVGGGEREAELRSVAEELGIASRVHWMGWRRDLAPVYPALDLLALPSRDEGTPVAVIEALAAGVPVVAASVGGVADVLERGRWGVMVDDPDPRSFAASLRRVLAAPPSPEARAAASERARDRFSEARLAREMSALYRELLRA